MVFAIRPKIGEPQILDIQRAGRDQAIPLFIHESDIDLIRRGISRDRDFSRIVRVVATGQERQAEA